LIGKSPIKSKSFWANLAIGAGAILHVIPANEYTLLGTAAVNLLLRFLTNRSLAIPFMRSSEPPTITDKFPSNR
jgi:hypothetical protein